MGAVRFKIRRSTTYVGTTSAIPAGVGELVSISTNTNNYTTQVGKKVYIGIGTETAGQASAFEAIGGSYYTQLLDGVAGVLVPSAAIITDANSRISGLNIASAGTLTLNNTVNTFNTTIKAAPSLAASYALTLPATVGTANQVLTTNGTGVLSWSIPAANTTVLLTQGLVAAYTITDSVRNYIGISTDFGFENINLGNTIAKISLVVKPNVTSAYNISDGTNTYFNIDTTTGIPLVTIPTGNLSLTSGVLATTATTANLVNTVATTVNLGGAATAVNIGASSGTTTVNNNLVVTGNVTFNGSTEVLNATNLSVQDAVIDFGKINNVAPTSATTFDLGQKYNYFQTTAKIATSFYQLSTGRFVFAVDSSESAGTLTVATPTVSVTNYAPVVMGSMLLNDQACATLGTAEAIVSFKTLNGVTGRFLDNVIIDSGAF